MLPGTRSSPSRRRRLGVRARARRAREVLRTLLEPPTDVSLTVRPVRTEPRVSVRSELSEALVRDKPSERPSMEESERDGKSPGVRPAVQQVGKKLLSERLGEKVLVLGGFGAFGSGSGGAVVRFGLVFMPFSEVLGAISQELWPGEQVQDLREAVDGRWAIDVMHIL